MVRHVIVWKIKDEFAADAAKIKAGVKEKLEGLAGRIPGMIDIKVITEGLASSNGDLMLDASYEDEASLKGYSVHPEHVKVADTYVRPYMQTRMCFDYEK